jgi:hypothetical protein
MTQEYDDTMRQARLATALGQLKHCVNLTQLLKVADNVDQGIRDAEFNFPAEIIMFVDMAAEGITLNHDSVRRSAEEAMLQLAFFNAGLNLPSPFIMACHQGGWRVRGGSLVLEA